ncbi:hypothetical protein [Geodermatophilus sp. SYSU D00696]
MPGKLSFCAYVMALLAPLQVADALDHPVFRDNPAMPAGATAPTYGCR